MSADSLLPIAPARVKVLCVPIGQIKADRFAVFLDRLHGEHVVHLRDVGADKRPNRTMFSPLAFPDGAIFYEFASHVPPPSHLALLPFDLYREPLVVIAVADGAEVAKVPFSKNQTGETLADKNIRALYQGLEDLRDTFPKALVHQLLLFDYSHPEDHPIPLPEGIVAIPPPDQWKRTTMRTIMCDVSTLLLAEMTSLAKSFEALAYIESPGQSSALANGADVSDVQKRRNSLMPVGRSASASGALDRKEQARMSMPPPLSKNPSLGASPSVTPGRPSTPVRSGLSNPPTNFDDIPGTQTPLPASPEPKGFDRPLSASENRSISQDRVSVHGFGSGGVNERWRNKGKARVTILMASMYLQAGRWTDSLKEAMDGATVSKSINDHLWHGKALEIIVVSLLLLSWAGVEYAVPQICLSPPDKSATNGVDEHTDPNQPEYMRRFQNCLPELLERILALYSRISAEHLPVLPMSESVIRFCRILAALHVADGKLGGQSLDMMIFGTIPDKPLTTSPRPMIMPPRTLIINILMRAFPGQGSELLTTPDRVTVLSGIAAVLGLLGYQRKKAMVIRELVSVVIGGLVEARTRGAAEVGIHPAAGLVALNNINGHSNGAVLQLAESDIERGLDAFLNLVMKTYGIVGHDIPVNSVGTKNGETEPLDPDSDAACLRRIQKQSAARLYGMRQLKQNILRACINFSEALPDFAGVLRFSSDLMRTAGSGIAPGPRQEDAAPRISVEEQVRLVTNISKTHSLTERIGLGHMEAEYWDEFLLRAMKLEPQAITRTPIEHAKTELPGYSSARTSQDVNPFIHNPFQKKPDKVAMVSNLVAGELATFKITLQNPYDVELDIVSAKIATEGVEFESSAEQVLIGAYRTQGMRITGTPKTSGSLRVTGALIRVRGCRERRFPIFSDPWSLDGEIKIKATGLAALDHNISLPTPYQPSPKPHHIDLNVITQQPVLVVKSTTLPQSSVMILEGERQTFSVTLQNLSATPADFLLFSFQDSTQEQLQTALNNRDATPAELYEYELILAKKQALRLAKPVGKRYIAPGDLATVEFEVLGKPGLTSCGILIDYAYFGVPPDEVEQQFFTRQVALQLTVTVNASVEIARMDVLPLHGSIPQPLWARTSKVGGQSHVLTSDKYCLLLLDLRNAWPSSMVAQLEIEDGNVIEEHILPGNTARVIVPVRRVYLEDPHASIPALNPSRHRQFVVSTGKITPDVERANREAFWYREKILDRLKGTWKTGHRPLRTGSIELRSMRLTSRMIEAVKVDEIGIEVSVEDPSTTTTPTASAAVDVIKTKAQRTKNTVGVDDFVQIRVHITNRTEAPIYPTLRLMPALCHRPLNVALDYTRKFAWNGTLQQFLPLLPGKQATDVLVGVTALCRGEFEITASVEETRVWRPTAAGGGGGAAGGEESRRRWASGAGSAARLSATGNTPAGPDGRPRSSTQELMDLALGARERRIWHSRQPCRLVVRDRE